MGTEIVREPAVAGTFYSSDAKELRSDVELLLNDVNSNQSSTIPKAIIAPHAGYIYSGLVAAHAYACLKKAVGKINKIILIGPAHRYIFDGIAVPKATFFKTPLGKIKIVKKITSKILDLPDINVIPEAHMYEHSLEVQLPFLQILLENFYLLPLLVGNSNADEVSRVLKKIWGDSKTLIIVSSDLSHYLDYETAQEIDKKTAEAILALKPDMIEKENACGTTAIQGLLQVVKEKKLTPSLIKLMNSGDMMEDLRDRVVGYGAFHFV